MAVIRPPMPTLGFTLVPNAWLRDPELPQGPKALLAYYLSHAEGYRCSVSQAAREQGVGRDTVGKQNAKLVALGYLVNVEQTRADRGRWAENDYAISTVTDRVPPRPVEGVSDNPTLPGVELSPGTVPVVTGTVGPGTVNPTLRRQPLEDHETPPESRRGAHLAAVPSTEPTTGQRADRLAKEHYEAAGKLGGSRAFLALRGIVAEAVEAGHPDQQIRAALAHLRSRGRSVTRAALGPLLAAGNSARAVGGSNYGPTYRNPDPTDPANAGAFDGAF